MKIAEKLTENVSGIKIHLVDIKCKHPDLKFTCMYIQRERQIIIRLGIDFPRNSQTEQHSTVCYT